MDESTTEVERGKGGVRARESDRVRNGAAGRKRCVDGRYTNGDNTDIMKRARMDSRFGEREIEGEDGKRQRQRQT